MIQRYKIKSFVLVLLSFVCRERIAAQVVADSITTEIINGIQVTWAPRIAEEQKTVLRKLVGNMVKVEGGAFQMGSDGYWNGYPIHLNETPIHTVSINDFYINKNELCWSEWKIVMGEQNSSGNFWNDSFNYSSEQPMCNCTYQEVLEYIQRLNALTGLTFRLPAEAEWEYAAKGGRYSKDYIFSGSNDPDEVAWYKTEREGSIEAPSVVGQKQPNELGLYDMCGNVSELVEDSYRANYESDADDGYCTVRGGNYLQGDMWISNTVREMYGGDADQTIGFRLAL